MNMFSQHVFKLLFLSSILLSTSVNAAEVVNNRFIIQKVENHTILLNNETGASWRFAGDRWVKIHRYEDVDLDLRLIDNEEDYGFIPFDDLEEEKPSI